MNLNWASAGACVNTDPNQWFDLIDYPDILSARGVDALRNICRSCPVRAKCLEWALRHENFGMWGGLTPRERQELRRNYGIAAEGVA